MKTACILGATGGYGKAVADTLHEQGWALNSLIRHPEAYSARANEQVFPGSITEFEKLEAAAQDAEVMIYGINPANYDWENKALRWLEMALKVAKAQNMLFVFPGNVYVFNPDHGPVFEEDSLQEPSTRKGEIRQQMEARLRQAAENGVKVVILRMGDFIAHHGPSTWMNFLLKETSRGYHFTLPGPADLPHTWAYLPDAAKITAQIIEKRDALADFNPFHMKGHRASFQDLAQALKRISPKPVKLKQAWWFPLLRILTPFSIMLRGVMEMRYLWQHEIYLDDSQLERFLGQPIPHTPLPEVLAELLQLNPPQRDSDQKRGGSRDRLLETN